jgi:hypothetical protein
MAGIYYLIRTLEEDSAEASEDPEFVQRSPDESRIFSE